MAMVSVWGPPPGLRSRAGPQPGVPAADRTRTDVARCPWWPRPSAFAQL